MKVLDSNTASEVSAGLLEIEAIKLQPNQPFTWASGWKSPIYCDNRLSLSYPKLRSLIKNGLIQAIITHFPNVEAIAGVATAGIPQGALIADQMDLPFLYVRSKPKGHGMENMIEGKITAGQKVVVIEDLISTGGSSLKAVNDLKNAGFEVMGMAAIFTYGFDIANDNFKNAGVDLVCLSNFEALLPLAVEKSYIDANTLSSLESWRKDPGNWRG
jgi:orotate phosphoribosyltransferase